MKKYQLMAPGPTPVPSEVLLAMAQPMIHHRTPQYEALFVEVRAGLKKLFQTSAEVVPLACSGTGAMEAAVINTLSAGDSVAVIRAGKFGDRWLELARAYGLNVIDLTAPFGHTVDASRLGDPLGGYRIAERRRQVDHVESIRPGDLEPAVAEFPGADHDDAIARRQRVDDRRFHCARPRARERHHLGARLEEPLEAGPHLDEHRLVLRGPVVDHRLRHREEDLARNRRGPRRHQLVLLHADGLLRGLRFDSMVTRPSAAERPSAVTKIASLPAACGEKNSTTSRS